MLEACKYLQSTVTKFSASATVVADAEANNSAETWTKKSWVRCRMIQHLLVKILVYFDGKLFVFGTVMMGFNSCWLWGFKCVCWKIKVTIFPKLFPPYAPLEEDELAGSIISDTPRLPRYLEIPCRSMWSSLLHVYLFIVMGIWWHSEIPNCACASIWFMHVSSSWLRPLENWRKQNPLSGSPAITDAHCGGGRRFNEISLQLYIATWMFPKIAVPPKPSILIGFSIIYKYKPSILGYHYFWKHPHCPNHEPQIFPLTAVAGQWHEPWLLVVCDRETSRRRFRWWKPLPYCWGHCCPSAVVQVQHFWGETRESSGIPKQPKHCF